MKRKAKIIFFGTPNFAIPTLKSLINSKYSVLAVVTTPDKPQGRGNKIKYSAVKDFAISSGIKIFQPENLDKKEFYTKLIDFKADLFVVVAFRKIPKKIWSIPKHGTFNLHASLLPQYRGAAPIHWSIINGERESGLTTFFINEKIDNGDILCQKKIKIELNDCMGTLEQKMMSKSGEIVIKTINAVMSGKITPIKQLKNTNLKKAPKLNKENTKIDWKQSGLRISNFVKGLNPKPCAWTYVFFGNVKLKAKIKEIYYENCEPSGECGIIMENKKKLIVNVVDGIIYINEIHLEGKKSLKISDFLNGFKVPENSYFS